MIDPMEFPQPDERKTYPPDCTVCMGTVAEDVVTLTYPVSRGSSAVQVVTGVTGGVCKQCGEIYLLAETVEEIDRILASPPEREETHPVWSYAHGA
ncbi:MAG: type II toxin-antitoxin system MqsA family antitoxin [Actinobacteria bacterium]|nr:type II toxin-antitoxin system MqsA family antitoxin [Actinomycetota bacterium]